MSMRVGALFSNRRRKARPAIRHQSKAYSNQWATNHRPELAARRAQTIAETNKMLGLYCIKCGALLKSYPKRPKRLLCLKHWYAVHKELLANPAYRKKFGIGRPKKPNQVQLQEILIIHTQPGSYLFMQKPHCKQY
jgi:hypothetical protein